MNKQDLQTFVAVIDAAQKAGIIAPDAMGLVYNARVSAIALANKMSEKDTLGIIPTEKPLGGVIGGPKRKYITNDPAPKGSKDTK